MPNGNGKPGRSFANDSLPVSVARGITPAGVLAIIVWLFTQGTAITDQLRENCYVAERAIQVELQVADNQKERDVAEQALRAVNCHD